MGTRVPIKVAGERIYQEYNSSYTAVLHNAE